MIIEFDNKEKEFLDKTEIVASRSREELVKLKATNADIDIYKENIYSQTKTFVDWFIDGLYCFVEKNGICYTTSENEAELDNKVFESIINKIHKNIKIEQGSYDKTINNAITALYDKKRIIELDEDEVELLSETDIVVASNRRDLVEAIYDSDDVDDYTEEILYQDMNFVDWFIDGQDCYLERNGLFFTTFSNGFDQEIMESIIDKICRYIDESGTEKSFEEILELIKEKIENRNNGIRTI